MLAVRRDAYHAYMTLLEESIASAPSLLEQPVASAEFLVVDTETNGLGGDACEMTEVGAVLVGGGELHDRFVLARAHATGRSGGESSGSPGSRRRCSRMPLASKPSCRL